MKNYAEMSDHDINAAVASSLGVDFDSHESGIYASVKWCGDNVVSVAGIVDYCNNWADAGPVIEENNIWIQPDMIGDGLWHCYDREDEFHSKHANPLRAAMIVFLMMKDAENKS